MSYEDLSAAVGVTVNLTTLKATVLGNEQDLVGIESVISGPGDDTLIGTTGDNLLNGGLGSDTVSYEGRLDAISASLATNKGGGTAPEKDTYVSIENLTGGDAGDTLVGDSEPNVLRGLGGDDHLGGNGGADLLVPGSAAARRRAARASTP